MSSSVGSLVFAFFCAARRMNFCLFIASSSARIDRCRPTKSGTTMCGKTMMSLSGRSATLTAPGREGSFLSLRKSMWRAFLPSLRGLGGLLVQHDRLFLVRDHFFRDQDLF